MYFLEFRIFEDSKTILIFLQNVLQNPLISSRIKVSWSSYDGILKYFSLEDAILELRANIILKDFHL